MAAVIHEHRWIAATWLSVDMRGEKPQCFFIDLSTYATPAIAAASCKGWKKKGSLFLELDIDTVFFGIPVCNGLDSGDLGILPLRLEEVAEPLLGF